MKVLVAENRTIEFAAIKQAVCKGKEILVFFFFFNARGEARPFFYFGLSHVTTQIKRS